MTPASEWLMPGDGLPQIIAFEKAHFLGDRTCFFPIWPRLGNGITTPRRARACRAGGTPSELVARVEGNV